MCRAAVVAVKVMCPWKVGARQYRVVAEVICQSLSTSSFVREAECRFSLLRSRCTTLTDFKFDIRLETDVGFEFDLVCL